MTQKSDPVIEKMHARKLQSRKLGSLGFAFTSPVRHLHCSPAFCHLRWDTIRLLKLNTLWPKPNSRFSLSNLLLSHLPNLSTWKALCVPLLGLKFSSFFLSHPTSNPSKILLALLLNVSKIPTLQQLHCYHLSPSLCHLL